MGKIVSSCFEISLKKSGRKAELRPSPPTKPKVGMNYILISLIYQEPGGYISTTTNESLFHYLFDHSSLPIKTSLRLVLACFSEYGFYISTYFNLLSNLFNTHISYEGMPVCIYHNKLSVWQTHDSCSSMYFDFEVKANNNNNNNNNDDDDADAEGRRMSVCQI